MAKKRSSNPADAVLAAVDQAFQAQAPRDRIADLVDELSQTAGRLRGAVDDIRPASAEEVKALRADVRELARRLDALEASASAKRAPAKRSPAKKAAPAPSTKSKTGAARRAASERSTGRRGSSTKRSSS